MKFKNSRNGLIVMLALVQVAAAHDATQAAHLVPADAAVADRAGRSVAVDGDTIVVGAYLDDHSGLNDAGSAYVFVRVGSVWSEQAKLTASDPSSGDEFGHFVSISGATVIVGAPNHLIDGTEKGSAYVFVRVGTSWSQQAMLVASDSGTSDRFGSSVAIDGDTAVVGAPGWDGTFPPTESTGAIYVFERSGTVWTEQARLRGDIEHDGNGLGDAVALWDGTVVSPTGLGAFVFTRTGTIWSNEAILPGGWGGAVSIYGDTFVVGTGHSGRVFVGGGASWVQEAELQAHGTAGGDFFGWSVSIFEDTIVIGAPRDDPPVDAGSAYIFMRHATGWIQEAHLRPNVLTALEDFGESVAVVGETVVVGAPGFYTTSFTGSAYVFALSEVETYCYCTDSAPCGNEDPRAGCVNSTGSGSLLRALGTSSAGADDLILTATGVPPNQPGILFMGGAQLRMPFGDGFVCVGAGSAEICRLPVQDSGPSGALTQGPGIVALLQALGGACQIDLGETWKFQAWYRDPTGPCGGFFNLSNAVSVTFAP